jgi:DNA polymerase-3 subunit chi
LGEPALIAGNFACRLAMMAWERKQRVFITASSQTDIRQLDELLWQYPPGRFLPHATADDTQAGKAPVKIGTISGLKPTDVVINLCPEAIPQPTRFDRVLEIVPFAREEREASRQKYKSYRKLGLNPRTHEINK